MKDYIYIVFGRTFPSEELMIVYFSYVNVTCEITINI